DAAYAALGRCDHFYTEALRGWVRTLQLRLSEAESHFDRSRELARGIPSTIPNLTRRFLSEAYSAECALLRGPPPRSERVPLTTPAPAGSIASERPEVRVVIESCRACEARFLLHAGDFERGARIFGRLLSERQGERGAELAAWYLGLAACQHGLDLGEPAIRSLENAELATLSAEGALPALRDAACLAAFWTSLGAADRAREWRIFLDRFPCPEPTRTVFRRRSEIIARRCRELGWLVVL